MRKNKWIPKSMKVQAIIHALLWYQCGNVYEIRCLKELIGSDGWHFIFIIFYEKKEGETMLHIKAHCAPVASFSNWINSIRHRRDSTTCSAFLGIGFLLEYRSRDLDLSRPPPLEGFLLPRSSLSRPLSSYPDLPLLRTKSHRIKLFWWLDSSQNWVLK